MGESLQEHRPVPLGSIPFSVHTRLRLSDSLQILTMLSSGSPINRTMAATAADGLVEWDAAVSACTLPTLNRSPVQKACFAKGL